MVKSGQTCLSLCDGVAYLRQIAIKISGGQTSGGCSDESFEVRCVFKVWLCSGDGLSRWESFFDGDIYCASRGW
eukprot:9245936-Lingulodinium_polyedra.AAC.1